MSARREALALLLLLRLPMLGCAPPATPPTPVDASVDVTGYDAMIAAPHAVQGYTPLDADAGIEMRMGFQGFRYTRIVVVATGAVPEYTAGSTRLEIDGFDPSEQRFAALTFRELSAGVFLSTPLLVFANDVNLTRATGRHARLTIQLENHCCRAIATLEGPVRFDPDCIEDAQFRCLPTSPPDGGGL